MRNDFSSRHKQFVSKALLLLFRGNKNEERKKEKNVWTNKDNRSLLLLLFIMSMLLTIVWIASLAFACALIHIRLIGFWKSLARLSFCLFFFLVRILKWNKLNEQCCQHKKSGQLLVGLGLCDRALCTWICTAITHMKS